MPTDFCIFVHEKQCAGIPWTAPYPTLCPLRGFEVASVPWQGGSVHAQ